MTSSLLVDRWASTFRRRSRTRRPGSPLAMLLAGCALAVLSSLSPAQTSADGLATSTAVEQRVKAASLFRFLSYVEWPPSPSGANEPYRIGVIDADDIARELTSIVAGRVVNSRAVVVKRMHRDDEASDVDELYIGGSDSAKSASIIRRLRTLPVLIVTNADGALTLGSMINFRVVDDHVRFEVALDAAEQARLRISSRMLAIALQVTGAQR